jgi:hypothetical protein
MPSANTMGDGFVEYVPSPSLCWLGILRQADRFTLLGSIRYGLEPRLKLFGQHLTVIALPSVLTHGQRGFDPAFGYEYRSTTAQEDSHFHAKRPTGRTES